jgi:serine protease inhibitor
MKSIPFLLIIMLSILITSCSRKTYQAMEKESPENNRINEDPVPLGNIYFAFDLLQALPEYEDNFSVSPFSISTALAMTYAGAREATQQQMAQVMHFHPDQSFFHDQYAEFLRNLREAASGDVQLNIANKLWAQQDYHFLPEFFEVVEINYNSGVNQVDFMANREEIRGDINQWVYEQTRENIKDLIAPDVLTEDTRLVLVNAIHFFGPWLKEFDKELTREDNFTNAQGERQRTQFMYGAERLPYFIDQYMQVIEIPYTDEKFSMLVLLPKEGVGLAKMEENLDVQYYLEMVDHLEVPDIDMEVLLPRFKMESKIDLEATLSKMGMNLAFSNKADFSGMTGDLDLKIDRVIHQAIVDVTEEGTEAAAATAVVMIRKTSIEPEEKILFRANRPFLFIIKENESNSILFMGRMNNAS